MAEVNRVFTKGKGKKQIVGDDSVNIKITLTSKEDGKVLEEVVCGGFVGTLFGVTDIKEMDDELKADYVHDGWAQLICLDTNVKPHVLMAGLIDLFQVVKGMLDDLSKFSMDLLKTVMGIDLKNEDMH